MWFSAGQSSVTGLNDKALRRWLLLFFLLLLIPIAMLVRQAYTELKWEAFHQQRQLSEALARRIDERLVGLIEIEEKRLFTDYAFLNIAGDPTANFLQRSPLAQYPVKRAIPGLIGYFQVDAESNFSTPHLPAPGQSSADLGISSQELKARSALADRIRAVLSENQLVSKRGKKDDEYRRRADASGKAKQLMQPEVSYAQSAFDQLSSISRSTEKKQRKQKNKLVSTRSLGRVSELDLDTRYQKALEEEVLQDDVVMEMPAVAAPPMRQLARKERSVLPATLAKTPTRVLAFESEIDSFEFNLLDSGHFVLYRKVWRDNQRYIQGLLISQQVLINDVINNAFNDSSLSDMNKLIVAYQGEVLAAFSGQNEDSYLTRVPALTGSLLYQTRLSAPLSELELLFTVRQLPVGPGAAVVFWSTGLLLLVLVSGFYLFYRLGIRQIAVLRQQQDFVSAVSHELKTPLTSIRMYGEMLREGWAPEEKKNSYYNYIYDESERLSRLINNVLQLARMTRNKIDVDLKTIPVSALMDDIISKVSTQVERAGFELDIVCDQQLAASEIRVDIDYFAQVVINLVDNALKFSRDAELKRVEIRCYREGPAALIFSVRDFGPGIAKQQLKKIFQLFYRSENELTRETVGTGIGLALVHQLTSAMNGQVDVVNKDPGVEFKVIFTRLG